MSSLPQVMKEPGGRTFNDVDDDADADADAGSGMIVIVTHCFLAISQRGRNFDYSDWDDVDGVNDYGK